MKKQSILSVLWISALFLFLFATITSCTEKIGKTKIKIFQANQAIATELEQAAKEYENSHPNVVITVQTVESEENYEESLRKKLKSGKSLNIFSLPSPRILAEWKDKLEYLGNLRWAALVHPNLLSDVTFGEKIYAIPYEIKSYGFIYNKRIFKAAGIDVSSFRRFEDFERSFETLDAQIKSGTLKKEFPLLESLTEFPAQNPQFIGLYGSSPVLGEEFINVMETLNTKNLLFPNAFFWKDLIDLQVKYSSSRDNPSALLAVDETAQIERGLAVERVAFIQQGNWIYSRVATINKEVADNLGIFPLPLSDSSFQAKIVAGATMYWAVNKDTNHWSRIAAKDFLDWLYMTKKISFVSPILNNEPNQPTTSLNKEIMSYLNAGKTIPWVYTGFPLDWATNTLGTGIQEYIAGKISWGTMISRAIEHWEKLRKSD